MPTTRGDGRKHCKLLRQRGVGARTRALKATRASENLSRAPDTSRCKTYCVSTTASLPSFPIGKQREDHKYAAIVRSVFQYGRATTKCGRGGAKERHEYTARYRRPTRRASMVSLLRAVAAELDRVNCQVLRPKRPARKRRGTTLIQCRSEGNS